MNALSDSIIRSWFLENRMNIFEKIYNNSSIPLQTAMLNIKAAELYIERYGKKFRELFDEFNNNQWLTESQIIERQNENLAKLISHAYKTVPYYHKIMKKNKLQPSDIKTIADLHKFPILTKNDIINNFSELISTDYKNKWSTRSGHTSGTTGTPLSIIYNIKTCVAHHAADWRQKNWAGLDYGQSYASLQGRLVVPITQNKPPFWRMNYINNQMFMSSFHLKDDNLPHYFDALEKRNIRFIEGYPSNLYILALYLNKHNQTFPMKSVLTSSETLFDFQREAIEKAFLCKIFDFYGMAERVVFATECEHHKGHHLNMDYGITEFLDSNSNHVQLGKLGNIVATGLYNYAMPLIRYKTNDSSSLKQKKCSCGRSFPLMDDVATKNESVITLPDGRLMSPSVLTHPFKPMHSIDKSQIIQEKLDELEVRIVKKPSYSLADEKLLIQGFEDRLGLSIKIVIKYVDEIPNNINGKFQWVISIIKPEF